MESFGKGLAGLAKQAMNHPISTAAVVGAGAVAVVATGGAILPVMVVAGAVAGTGMAGYGAYKAATAETDAEAKQAWETIGNGAFAATTSALGAKASLSAAANAGVTSAKGAGNMNGMTYSVLINDGIPGNSFSATPREVQSLAQEWILNNLNKVKFTEGKYGDGIPQFGPRAR